MASFRKYFGSVLLVSLAFSSLLATLFAPNASAASTTPFSFKSFEASYNLSAISNTNASHLTINEKLTAEFAPSGNNNHGISRVIPTRLKIGNGRSWSLGLIYLSASGGPYTSRDLDADALTITIGDKNNYVHGQQTYAFNYTAMDVVMPNEIITDKTQDGDEFHWMVNGDAWSQSFDQVTATVTVAPNLVSALDGRVACWNNEVESECQITSNDLPDGSKQFVFTGLTTTKSQKSLVFDIGFHPETFAFPANFYNTEDEAHGIKPLSIWAIFGLILLFLAPVLIYFVYKLSIISHNRRKVKHNPIIPQFVAPNHDIGTLPESEVFWANKNLFAPLLLNWAVNGYISITADKKGRPDGIIYEKPDDALMSDPNETAIFRELTKNLQIGDKIRLQDLKNTRSFGKKLYDVQNTIEKSQFDKEKGFFKGRHEETSGAGKAAGVVAVVPMFVGFFIFIIPIIENFLNGYMKILLIILASVVIVGVIFSIICSRLADFDGVELSGKPANLLLRKKKLTDRGANLLRYLIGLKEFMSVSEAERIKMLQSAKTAEKIDTSISGSKIKLIQLYERLLPFATIFGIEKDWGKILQIYYTEVDYTPGFYHGYISGYAWGMVLGSLASDARTLSGLEAGRIASQTLSRSSSWSSGGSSSSGFGGGGGGSFGGGGGGGSGW